MIHATGSFSVARPPEYCFDFIADLHNEPKFNPDASDIVKTTEGPIGLGTVYTEKVKPLGRFEVTIDRYERPSALGFDARSPRADISVRFHFTPEGDGTRLDAEIEIHMKGFARAVQPLLRPFVQRMYERKRTPGLKRALEAGG